MIYKVIKKSHSCILFNCFPIGSTIKKGFVTYLIKARNSKAR